MTFTKLVQDDSKLMKKEDEQSDDNKRNKATIVNIVVVIFLMKSNESYCKIIFDTPKNSSIEISNLKNVYECKIKNNNSARYIDLITQNQNNEYCINSNSNNLVKNEMNSSIHRPCLYMIPEINSVIETSSRKNIHLTTRNNIDKTLTACPRSSITDQNINKSQFNNLQTHLTKTLLYSSLPFSDNYSKTSMMVKKTCEKNLKHETSIDSKLKLKTILTDPLKQIKKTFINLNKTLILNNTVNANVKLNPLNESKLTLNTHSPHYQIIREKHAKAGNISERFYLKTTCEIEPESNDFSFVEGKRYGVLTTTTATTKTFQYIFIPQNNITMNSQYKVTLMHKFHGTTHNLPKRRFKNKSLGQKKLKNMWQKGMVAFGKKQPGGINKHRQRTILINRLINKWINVTTINMLLQRAMHIKTIRAKLIKSVHQPMESSPIAIEQLLRVGYKNDTFILTTEIPALNQLPNKMSNDLHTKNHLGPISKQSLQLDSNVEQNSSVNIRHINSDNIILTSKVTKSAGQTITETAYHEINEVVTTKPKEDLTITFEFAHTVRQSENLPIFNDMENSNSNISLKSVPHASSVALNRNKTMKYPKKKISSKKIGIGGKQSKATKFHKKSKKTEDTTKESRWITMYRKMQPVKVTTKSLKQKQDKKMQLAKVTAKKTLKDKHYKKLKLTSVEVSLIKPIKQKQNKKTLPTKITAKKWVKQKQHKKLKLTSVSVKKYKISKQNKMVPLTKVPLIKSLKQRQYKKTHPTKITAKKTVKQKQRMKLKLTSVPVKKKKISKHNKKVPPTKVSLIESLKQKQDKKMHPTKITAKKTVMQKQRKKLKQFSVPVEKYKIPKKNKKEPPTKVLLVESLEQKQNIKMQPTKVTAKKSVKHKQHKKLKLTSVPVKKYKMSKHNKKVPLTKVSLIEPLKQKQDKKKHPTKVTAKKSVKQKQSKKLKLTSVPVKKYKISKHNKVKPIKTTLNNLISTKIQRMNDKDKHSNVSKRKKHSKSELITKKNIESFKRLKHIKTEKASKHFKKQRTTSTMNQPKKSKSQSQNFNEVSIKSVERQMIMTTDVTIITTKLTEKTTQNYTDAFIEENIPLLNTTFNLQNRSIELMYRKKKRTKSTKDVTLYWKPDVPFNSYNNYNGSHNNVYVFGSSGLTDRNNINNLIIVDFDTTPKSTTTPTPRPTQPPPKITTTACPNRFFPTVTFLKRTGFMEFNVIVTAIFLGLLKINS